MQDKTMEDISRFANATLSKHRQMQIKLESEHHRFEAERSLHILVDKAEGVFIWVRLALDLYTCCGGLLEVMIEVVDP